VDPPGDTSDIVLAVTYVESRYIWHMRGTEEKVLLHFTTMRHFVKAKELYTSCSPTIPMPCIALRSSPAVGKVALAADACGHLDMPLQEEQSSALGYRH
jgi:hypothetical protein